MSGRTTGFGSTSKRWNDHGEEHVRQRPLSTARLATARIRPSEKTMPDRASLKFEKSVFINCPFDEEYYPLLRPLLFTILSFGFNPRIALESSDSGEQRMTKICQLIRSARYAIHDLSRLQSKKRNEFYRLNMAFELGIEYGIRHLSSTGRFRTKKCLILGQEKHTFMKALSDLAGVDIKNHKNDPLILIRQLRSWFIETIGLTQADSPTVIWYNFNDFMKYCYDEKKSKKFSDEDIRLMPVPEFISSIQNWLSTNP